MRLVGLEITNELEYGVEGQLRLPGWTILIGRNGAGKTRTLDAVEGFSTDWGASEKSRGRLEGYGVPYGYLYLECDSQGRGASMDWRWLAALTLSRSDDCAVEVTEEPRDPLDYRQRVWMELRTRAQSEVPEELHGCVAGALFALLDHPTLSYQNHELGSVGLAYRRGSATQQLIDFLKAAPIQIPAGHWLQRLVEAVLNPDAGQPFVSLLSMGDLGEGDDYDLHRLRLPGIEWVEAEAVEVDRVVHEAVDRIVRMRPRSNRTAAWIDEHDDGSATVRQAVRDALASLQQQANASAPSVVVERGQIRLQVLPISQWTDDAPRTIVTLDHKERGEIDYRDAGSGSRRWIAAAVLRACNSVGREPLDEGQPAPVVDPRRLMLVDEPELHLHPAAQRDIGRWLRRNVSDNLVFLTATHSPELLRLRGDDVAVVMVMRSGGIAHLHEITSDVVGNVRDLAEGLGLDPLTWLQLTRGVLVVEGEHDKAVIDHFFGADLERERVSILAIRGTNNALALVDSDFLGRAGIPLRVIFDDTRKSALQPNWTGKRTAEEKKLERVLKQLRYQEDDQHDILGVPYPEPDILCALPPEAIARAYPQAHFLGWGNVLRQWEQVTGKGFKPWLMTLLRLKVEPADFIRRVLNNSAPGDQPSAALTEAVHEALRSLDRA